MTCRPNRQHCNPLRKGNSYYCLGLSLIITMVVWQLLCFGEKPLSSLGVPEAQRQKSDESRYALVKRLKNRYA